ncbi:MAG: hypothetical protein VW169_07915 [Rhodospirillaceae bacterium]
MRTTHSAYDSGGEKTQAFERQVRFDVRDRFYRDPPRCTTVLSVQRAGPAGFKEQVRGRRPGIFPARWRG